MVPEGVATFLVVEEGVAKTPIARMSETCRECGLCMDYMYGLCMDFIMDVIVV